MLEDAIIKFETELANVRSELTLVTSQLEIVKRNSDQELEKSEAEVVKARAELESIKSQFKKVTMTPFFKCVQTSVRLCAYGSKKVLGKIGFILKLRNVKICSLYF